MSENTTEAKELSAEDLKALFDALPKEFQDTIAKVNESIATNNSNVARIKAADAKDQGLIKAEIYEQNTANHSGLAKLRERELKALEAIEKIRAEAYSIIESENLMPGELSETELQSLKTETQELRKDINESTTALAKFEEMMPMFKGKLTVHLGTVETLRGSSRTSSSNSGEAIKRPRFKRILVNGVTEDEKGNKVYALKDGEEKYTFSTLVVYLKKQDKNLKISGKDLIEAYYGDKESQDDLPDSVEMTFPHTFKDANGNEQTVNYVITAEK